MSFFFNGQTSAKKMLYKRGKYSKAYVGDNLVHTGTALTRYITWKVSGNYVVVRADGFVNTTLNLVFRVVYEWTYSNESNTIQRMSAEEKYLGYGYGYGAERTISLNPSSQPSAPPGYTLVSYTTVSISAYSLYPQSDELYTYSFKAL